MNPRFPLFGDLATAEPIIFPELHIAPISPHPDPKNDQYMVFTVWHYGKCVGTAMTTKTGNRRYSFYAGGK